jgi:hypothetical protein
LGAARSKSFSPLTSRNARPVRSPPSPGHTTRRPPARRNRPTPRRSSAGASRGTAPHPDRRDGEAATFRWWQSRAPCRQRATAARDWPTRLRTTQPCDTAVSSASSTPFGVPMSMRRSSTQIAPCEWKFTIVWPTSVCPSHGHTSFTPPIPPSWWSVPFRQYTGWHGGCSSVPSQISPPIVPSIAIEVAIELAAPRSGSRDTW